MVTWRCALRWVPYVPFIRSPFILPGGVCLFPQHVPAEASKLSHYQKSRQGVKALLSDLSHPTVWGLLPAWSILGVSSYTAVWFHQPLWARSSMPLVWYGWAWAALNSS